MSIIDSAIQDLEEKGYAVLEGLIPETRASQFADRVLEFPNPEEPMAGYRIARGLLNFDAQFADLVAHPVALEITRYLIGGRTEAAKNAFAWPEDDRVRLAIVDAVIADPGSEPGWWHVDPPMAQSVRQDSPLPDFPLVVNVFWILTPFAAETGATRLMPGSHRWRKMPPETCDDLEGQDYLTAPVGSLAIVPNTQWHAAGKNQSDQSRIAVACVFTPWWIGQMSGAAQPIERHVWNELPADVQALTKHQLHWPGE